MSSREPGEHRVNASGGRYCIEDVSFILVEYDREGDSLHIIFSKEAPDESVLASDDIIVNLKEGKLVSIVVENASKKLGIGGSFEAV